MKQNISKIFVFAVFILFSAFNLFGNELIDIRIGSYKGSNFLKKNETGSDKTRIIIEFEEKVIFQDSYQSGKLTFLFKDTKYLLDRQNFLINNGLISQLEISSIKNNKEISIYFEGSYREHKVHFIKNPTRLVIDVLGTPIEIVSEKPQKKEKKLTTQPLNISQNIQTSFDLITPQIKNNNFLSETEINALFESNSKLYIDLYEVPINQVVRYFSKQSSVDLITEKSVQGEISLNIKNQTIRDAFKLFLRSEGLSVIEDAGSFFVTPSTNNFINHNLTQYSTYLNAIKVSDMESILKFYFGNELSIMKNEFSNKIDITISKNQTNFLDSLILKYDRYPPSFECKIHSFIFQRSFIDSLNFDNGFSINKHSINYLQDKSKFHRILSITNLFLNNPQTLLFEKKCSLGIGFPFITYQRTNVKSGIFYKIVRAFMMQFLKINTNVVINFFLFYSWKLQLMKKNNLNNCELYSI